MLLDLNAYSWPVFKKEIGKLAVLALRARDALELLAAEHVNRARELNGVTWEQVGERFDISMQSAHSRFRPRS